MKEVSSIKTLTTAGTPQSNWQPPPIQSKPKRFRTKNTTNQCPLLTPPPPTPRGEGIPLPDTFRQPTIRKRPLTPSSDEMEDLPDIRIPYLSSPEKEPSPPPPTRNPPLPFAPIAIETSDKDGLRTQLEVAETMRMIARSIVPITTNNSLHFTPAPVGGFPAIHLPHCSSSSRLLTSLKFLVRIFDYDGKEHETMNAVLTQRIRNLVSEIMNDHNLGPINPRVAPPSPSNGKNAKEFPKSFLVFDILMEVISMIIQQRVWSTPEITIEAHPFLSRDLPTSFMCLNGFTTSNPVIVANAVRDAWTAPETLGKIVEILEKSEIPLDRVYDAATYLCDLISVEFIDYKAAKAISLPRFNIFA
ncbi:hypothetical protein EDD22DRAFT_852182 [Suillus occidentalis]|nr:hypothetical protein EDD22DRAFT_852182 [Suillus occidentalis]